MPDSITAGLACCVALFYFLNNNLSVDKFPHRFIDFIRYGSLELTSSNMQTTFNLTKPIVIECDHAGFEYKEVIKDWLIEKGLQLKDFGTYSSDFC